MGKYKVHDVKIYNYQNICIIDEENDIVICHFNIMNDYDDKLVLANKMCDALNAL